MMHVQRNIHLDLPKNEADTFTRIAAARGMSPVQMIERIIHDVVMGSGRTSECLPALAYGYVRELERNNSDGSFKFPVFMQERHYHVFPSQFSGEYCLSDFRRDFLPEDLGCGIVRLEDPNYWSEYLTRCGYTQENPETMVQAIDSMGKAAKLYYRNINYWE